MTHPQHDLIIAQGWTYHKPIANYRPHGYYTLNNYANGLPNCHCNDRPPQITAEPYFRDWETNEKYAWSIELQVAAECANDEWIWIKSPTYQLPPSQWSTLIRRLSAAWTAAEAIQ